MEIERYDKLRDETKLLKIIENEEGWTYTEKDLFEKYKSALEKSITYVAYDGENLFGYSRSINDFDLYIYICDLLVTSDYRGQGIGKKLMECVQNDYKDFTIYVMSGVDEYYEKLGYKREGAIFEILTSEL